MTNESAAKTVFDPDAHKALRFSQRYLDLEICFQDVSFCNERHSRARMRRMNTERKCVESRRKASFDLRQTIQGLIRFPNSQDRSLADKTSIDARVGRLYNPAMIRGRAGIGRRA